MSAERKTSVLNYGFAPEAIDWIDLHLTTSYTTANLLQVGPWGPYEGEIEGIELDLRNVQELNDTATLTYGVDYREDEVAAGPSTNTRSVTEQGEVTGLYVQGEVDLTEAFTLTGGARYDDYSLDDRLGQHFDDDAISPNIGLIYHVFPELTLTGSYATAFRGPDINDAFRVDIAENDPDLEGESATNYELRLTYRKQGLLVEGGTYRNDIDDVITNTLPWSSVYTNAGELETEGVFLRAAYGTKFFNVSVQYNHADTEINGQTATRYQYSSLVSRIGDTWVIDASIRPISGLDMGWNARIVQGLDDILVPEIITGLPDTYIRKPGYTTHDAYIRWVPEFADYLTLTLTIKNLFDKQYLSHGSVENLTSIPGFEAVAGAPEPGRDIRISASLQF